MRRQANQRKGIILRFSLSETQRGENTIRISVILKYEFAESNISKDNCFQELKKNDLENVPFYRSNHVEQEYLLFG